MDKKCGCNEEHEECECGEDHHHDHECGCEEEMEFITLTLDDGEEVEYGVIGTFGVEDKTYMALLSDEEDIFLYEYVEIDEEAVDLINIEDDVEFEMVSDMFMNLFVEEE